MSRLVRLLAYISVLMLVVSGGTFAHEVAAHSHSGVISETNSPPHRHLHDASSETAAKTDLHCGAPILQLTKDYRLSFFRKQPEIETGEERVARISSPALEPPPPKATS